MLGRQSRRTLHTLNVSAPCTAGIGARSCSHIQAIGSANTIDKCRLAINAKLEAIALLLYHNTLLGCTRCRTYHSKGKQQSTQFHIIVI
jgi:hypothetical protein